MTRRGSGHWMLSVGLQHMFQFISLRTHRCPSNRHLSKLFLQLVLIVCLHFLCFAVDTSEPQKSSVTFSDLPRLLVDPPLLLLPPAVVVVCLRLKPGRVVAVELRSSRSFLFLCLVMCCCAIRQSENGGQSGQGCTSIMNMNTEKRPYGWSRQTF